MIKSFKSYLILEGIVNESILKFDTKFLEILNMMESPVSKAMIDTVGADIKTPINYIGVESDDMVTFSPDKANVFNTYEVVYENGFINSANLRNFEIHLGIKSFIPNIGSILYKAGDLSEKDILKCYPNWVGVGITHLKVMSGPDPSKGDASVLLMNGYIDSIESIGFHHPKKQSMKVGRLSKKILDMVGKKFSDREIEEFVNEFKSKVELLKNEFRNFELVSGKDISYWYSEDNYSKNTSASLQSSCMRHDKCQSYFGIYTKNKRVSLLIHRSQSDREKITGRSIVWSLNNGDTLMDRVYYSKDSEYNLFIEYAKSNGWAYIDQREEIAMMDGDPYEEAISVSLETLKFREFPYLDNLVLLDVRNKILTDKMDEKEEHYTLMGTDGNPSEYVCGKCRNRKINCDSCDGDGTVYCEDCVDGYINCKKCNGSTKVRCWKCLDSMSGCDECKGTGKLDCDCMTFPKTGKQYCPMCIKGIMDCHDCDGHGYRDCEECF